MCVLAQVCVSHCPRYLSAPCYWLQAGSVAQAYYGAEGVTIPVGSPPARLLYLVPLPCLALY